MTFAQTVGFKGPVTLNLFQGPFLLTGQSPVGWHGLADALWNAAPERAVRWMLKQVQHDGMSVGSVVS